MANETIKPASASTKIEPKSSKISVQEFMMSRDLPKSAKTYFTEYLSVNCGRLADKDTYQAALTAVLNTKV